MKTKTIAVTIGDINGIGPEVLLKALRVWQPPVDVRLVLLGPVAPMKFWCERLHLDFSLPILKRFGEIESVRGTAILPQGFEEVTVQAGAWTPESGQIAGDSLAHAADLAAAGKVDAIVTLPVSKAALIEAGYRYPGQTELIAERLHARHFAMMLMVEQFRVALVTTHLPLRQVPEALTTGGIVDKLVVIADELRQRFRIEEPRIVVTGLNPHAGEGGHLGREEIEIITPAVVQACDRSILAEGPFPADALFGLRAVQPDRIRQYDAYLAMYHDQGLIPLKVAGFGKAVNYTAGLPVVRTSPDHGTAYDLAGKGLADATSMIEALRVAVDIIARD